jgi:peptide-methionine (S)-S-oxide reductase
MAHACSCRSFRSIRLLAAIATLLAGGAALDTGGALAQEGLQIPPPRVDEAAGTKPEVAVLAGGCFWGVQGVFQHVAGVTNAVSGYAGGDAQSAQYETVGSGATGHAESVKITFDPKKISYGRILQIYFSVAHDPTQLNRQGPDRGTQYRSAVFPVSDGRKLPALILRSSIRRSSIMRPASPRSSRAAASMRQKPIIRTS